MLTTVRDLGAAVREARSRAGLSQQAVADRAGVPRQWVSRLETGSNPGAELRKVLDLLAALDLMVVLAPVPQPSNDPFDDLFEDSS
ncbi:MAG: helix-turn-helix transcriptional regulator [Ornithinimicrobium sp.]